MGLHIYIHIPFCMSKCRYCGFSSIKNSRPPEDDYKNAVLAEAKMVRDISGDEKISTVYFGGGTPTLFNAFAIGAILNGLNSLWHFEEGAEVSIEANPETITYNYALGLKSAGINRMSLGVQSFSDRILRFLGRVHDSRKAYDAYDSLRKAGFANVNVDMMYCLPSQEFTEIENDLVEIGKIAPEHVSAYMFSADTEWARTFGPFHEDITESFFFMVLEKLAGYGFSQYEISNFARTGHECRHNLAYWQYKPYIGLGAAAVSCMNGIRSTNEKDYKRYISLIHEGIRPAVSVERLSDEETDFERKFLSLRTSYGIPKELLPENIPQDLYEIRNGRMVLTPKGMLLSDEIFSML